MVGFCEEYDDELHCRAGTFSLGPATPAELPAIVALLRDDVLGAGREAEDLQPYERALDQIDQDSRNFLVAVRGPDGAVVGTMQLTLLPGLSRGGTTRLQIEGVRVASTHRGTGLGAVMFAWAHEHGRRHGAGLAQLTTDKTRGDARRFYEALGYRASHEGLKLEL